MLGPAAEPSQPECGLPRVIGDMPLVLGSPAHCRGPLMFRRTFLPCAYGAVALGLAAVAVQPVYGQDRSAQERLDRLERDLNMLQRQVYRGGPPPMGGDPGAAVGVQVRMDRLEEQMRELTGRVEEFSNQVEQLRHRME